MKRAWPYALALAVVVTGCYLALAPLLRSLSPAPTTSASQLSQDDKSTTVPKSSVITFPSPKHGKQLFVSGLATKTKKTKKAKKPATTTQPSTNSTGFANSPPTSSSSSSSATPSSSSSSSTSQAPKSSSTPKSGTTTKKATVKTGSATVGGGGIDQSQSSNGFAGSPNDAPVTGGQTLAPSGN